MIEDDECGTISEMIEWQGTPKNSEKSWRNATL
jgi:hypothetical protein